MMAFDTKNPSAATNKGRTVSKAYYKPRLPQARCPVGSLFFRLPVAAEGRLKKLLRQFTLMFSNRMAACQMG
jgi:hypothetical protein